MASTSLSSVLRSPQDRSPTTLGAKPSASTGSSTTSALNNFVEPIDVGVTVAGTYKSILSLSAPGVLKFCSLRTVTGTTRAIGLKIVIDGVTVCDFTSASIGVANFGIFAVGVANSGIPSAYERIPFNTLEVFAKSSIVEASNGINANIAYDLA
jgi:hypothetical protein